MKKFLFFFLFLSNIISYGQENILGEYIIESRCKIQANNKNFGDGCQNWVIIDLIFNNASVRILHEDLNSMSRDFYTDFGIKSHRVSAHSVPVKLRAEASRNWDRTIGRCGGNGSFDNSVTEKSLNYCSNRYINNDAIRWWDHDLSVDIYPNLVIQDPNGSENNFLPTKEKITIKSHYGFKNTDYNWQYSFDGFHWIDLSQYNGQSSIEVNAVDILRNTTDNRIGKFIQFRQKSQCNRASNIIFYRILKSAPKITTHGPAIKTSCYDNNDGEYKLYFDRPLLANEQISISLFNTAINQPVGDFTNITALQTGNTYNLTGLSPGNYQLKIIGTYQGIPTYSETTSHPLAFTVERNTPVDFSVSKTDIRCYQGTDGEIQLSASGGTLSGYQYRLNEGEWTPFSDSNSKTHTISGLRAGDYTIKIRDARFCEAKIQHPDNKGGVALGEIKVLPLSLSAPQKPLTSDYTLVQEPTFYGATNAKIVTIVEGGTPFEDHSYRFEWKNEQGQILKTVSSEYVSGAFYITLDQIPFGTYFLAIYDKNYDTATDKKSCSLIETGLKLQQPDPLKAEVKLVSPISCHAANAFGDETDKNPETGQRRESGDGAIMVTVSGGKAFAGKLNDGKPYKYTWKKQGADGSWKVLPVAEDMLSQLSDGNYAVNIEDANGIVLGTYKNNKLVSPTDIEYRLQQPEQLLLNIESKPASCKGADGYARAIAHGGTPPYTYLWSDGQTSEAINKLEAMSYFVTVTDARGCYIEGSVTIVQPDAMVITEEKTPLLCHNASEGRIALSLSGGTRPYRILWSTGATTPVIEQLAAGEYSVTITDAQGCSYQRTYTIENPEPLRLDLGGDRTLCKGQSLSLDITLADHPGAVYQWTASTGFTAATPVVEITEPGTYTAKITTTNGCIATDTIQVSFSQVDIDADFLVTTQSYQNEEVILVNVSHPKGEKTNWIITDDHAKIIEETEDYIILNFSKEGRYTVQLEQTQGDCSMRFEKDILVEPARTYNISDSRTVNTVKEFLVAPNPSKGIFEVQITLEKESPMKLRIYNILGNQVQSDRIVPETKNHRESFKIDISGVYILVLETRDQTLSKKIIIN